MRSSREGNEKQNLAFDLPVLHLDRLYLDMNLQLQLVITFKTFQEVINTLRRSRKAVFSHRGTKSRQLPGFPAVAMWPILKDPKSHLL